jgi:hypothetical protein
MKGAPNTSPGSFLLGIDLERLPLTDAGDPRAWEDLDTLTAVALAWLRRHRWRATFFTVGEVAERRPEMIAAIRAEGHEIACHTHAHGRLDRIGSDEFRRDLELNIAALQKAGAGEVRGFRAPFFSLTEKAAASAYRTLRACGIAYSSSVSSSRNLGGWSLRAPEVARRAGIVELPVTSLMPGIPLGGLYWRCCPESILLRRIRSIATSSECLASFFHPHDFYSPQADYLGREILLRNPLFYGLLTFGRRSLEAKLDHLPQLGFDFLPFGEYLERRGLLGESVENGPVLAATQRR